MRTIDDHETPGEIAARMLAAPIIEGNRTSIAMMVRQEIMVRDLPHRNGFRHSDAEAVAITYDHLLKETLEFADAKDQENPAMQREEIADMFNCVLGLAAMHGMSFAELDALAEHKLRVRFDGAVGLPTYVNESHGG